MKKKLILLAAITLALTSCRGATSFSDLFPPHPHSSSESLASSEESTSRESVSYSEREAEVEYEKKMIKVYDLIIEKENAYKTNLYKGQVELLFEKDDEYVPFITLIDYANLFKLIATEDISYSNIEQDNDSTIYISKGEDTIFIASSDFENKIIEFAGGLNSVTETRDRYENTSIDLGLDDHEYYQEYGDELAKYYFDEEASNIFIYNNKVYYPFSFLSYLFELYSSKVFFYNYQDVFVFEDYDDVEEYTYKVESDTVNAFIEMNEKINGEAPQHVLDDSYNLYAFIMRNTYGARSVFDLDMGQILKDTRFNEAKSQEEEKRVGAFYRLSQRLDDRHTYFYPSFWDKGTGSYNGAGSKYNKARQDYYAIYPLRSNANLKDRGVKYSSDGKTALVVFDSFSHIARPENGEDISKVSMDYLIEKDDIFALKNNLETIKNKGGVRNVIIDLSLNGGGFIAYCLKALCLIAKNANNVSLYLKDITDNAVYQYTGKFDSNLDGKYDLDDVYGDDFNFYIMTSSYSYSCGNAFPYLAQKLGLASTIGMTSGGGECAVYLATMPTGESLYYSSPLRLGTYEKGTFLGDENGGEVASKFIIQSSNTSRYNLDYLQGIIGG